MSLLVSILSAIVTLIVLRAIAVYVVRQHRKARNQPLLKKFEKWMRDDEAKTDAIVEGVAALILDEDKLAEATPLEQEEIAVLIIGVFLRTAVRVYSEERLMSDIECVDIDAVLRHLERRIEMELPL